MAARACGQRGGPEPRRPNRRPGDSRETLALEDRGRPERFRAPSLNKGLPGGRFPGDDRLATGDTGKAHLRRLFFAVVLFRAYRPTTFPSYPGTRHTGERCTDSVTGKHGAGRGPDRDIVLEVDSCRGDIDVPGPTSPAAAGSSAPVSLRPWRCCISRRCRGTVRRLFTLAGDPELRAVREVPGESRPASAAASVPHTKER